MKKGREGRNIFRKKKKTESNYDPLQKRPALDTNGNTNILNHTIKTEESEKNARREMEHDATKSGNLSKPNEQTKVMMRNDKIKMLIKFHLLKQACHGTRKPGNLDLRFPDKKNIGRFISNTRKILKI